MSEDEQGYAPASYLEPVEETASNRDVHPEDQTNQGESQRGVESVGGARQYGFNKCEIIKRGSNYAMLCVKLKCDNT